MFDYESYPIEYGVSTPHNPDDDIFDLTPDPAHPNPYWWEL